MKTVFEYLKSSIPADHCRQTRAVDLVRACVDAGFKPANVLDLGCGPGNTLDFFKSCLPGTRWVGVDIEESPEVARRTRTDAEFVTFDGVNLPFAQGEFDLIFSNQVLEHVRYPEKLLTEVRRVLAPAGLFIGQTSQLEPYHSYSYWNFTVFGFKRICDAADLDMIEIRPGIDGLTLTKRSYLGRPPEYSRWFAEESPLNVEIEETARSQKRSTQIINYRKLMYCGHFAFVCRQKAGKHPTGEPREDRETTPAGQGPAGRQRARRSRSRRKRQRSRSEERYKLALLGGMAIEYACPRSFHIPRALSGVGLAGYEPATMAAFLACAEGTEGAVFDVGANIGVYSLAAASALQKKCVAFEPFPPAGDVLADIAERYELPILLRRAALAQEAGSTTFYLSARSDMSNSLNPEFRNHRGEIVVETTTLDHEASIERPGVVKIDTETTEMDVLRGGQHVFRHVRPSVIIEILNSELAREARSFFDRFDYSVLELGTTDVWRRITGRDDDVVVGDERNWLASPHPLREDFLDRAAFWAESIRKLPVERVDASGEN